MSHNEVKGDGAVMEKVLTGSQKKYLRGLAHELKPIVQIGKGGLTDKLISHIGEVFQDHELIKVRFVEFKEEKKALAADIAGRVPCELVGLIGNIAIFYREHPDKDRRKILPDPL